MFFRTWIIPPNTINAVYIYKDNSISKYLKNYLYYNCSFNSLHFQPYLSAFLSFLRLVVTDRTA